MCLLFLLFESIYSLSQTQSENFDDRYQHNLIKFKLIEEHYELITNQMYEYQSPRARECAVDTCTYGKYYINHLRKEIDIMKYLMVNHMHTTYSEYITKKIIEQDKLIKTDAKYIMHNLIDSYNLIRRYENKLQI